MSDASRVAGGEHFLLGKLAKRRDAARKAIEPYRHQPFSFAGESNCIHLARAILVEMGHKPPAVIPFKDAAGAKRALRKMGHRTLEGLMDSLLPRIPAARMMVGDIAMLPGEPFGALMIHAGGTSLLGWHAAAPGAMRKVDVSLADVIAAWSVAR